jgi:hypothetical protein
MYIFDRRNQKLRYDFWLNLDRADYKQSIQWVGYLIFSSLVGLSILYLFFYGLSLDVRFGINIFDEPEVFWPPVVLGIESTVLLVVMFLVFRYLDKKYENRQKWTKRFRISMDDLDSILEMSLTDLSLQYTEITWESKLTGVVPVLKIEGRDISIQTFESGSSSSEINMIVDSPLDVSEALEIQKKIDSLIVVD